jgi:hypothetical protein
VNVGGMMMVVGKDGSDGEQAYNAMRSGSRIIVSFVA